METIFSPIRFLPFGRKLANASGISRRHPEDPFDYDAVQTPVIGTINIDGNPRKVVMQANRSGFLYVLDAHDGRLIAANTYGKVNWANGVSRETGRPNVTDVYKGALEGENVTVWPSVIGRDQLAAHVVGTPITGMLYINTIHVGMTYQAGEPRNSHRGALRGREPLSRTTGDGDWYPDVRGFLKAIDPLTGKSKWETPYKSPNFSSTMVTASNLVFTGVMTGEFQALDADTGKVLWSFQTPSGIVGQPVTWERNGKQYVTVIGEIGGVYAQRAGDPNLDNLPTGLSSCGRSRSSTSDVTGKRAVGGIPSLVACLLDCVLPAIWPKTSDPQCS